MNSEQEFLTFGGYTVNRDSIIDCTPNGTPGGKEGEKFSMTLTYGGGGDEGGTQSLLISGKAAQQLYAYWQNPSGFVCNNGVVLINETAVVTRNPTAARAQPAAA